jgi:hypothetical protein
VGDFFSDAFATMADCGHGGPAKTAEHKHYELFFCLMEMQAQSRARQLTPLQKVDGVVDEDRAKLALRFG